MVVARDKDSPDPGYPSFELATADVRIGDGRAIVDHAEFGFYDSARLDATGEVSFESGGELALRLAVNDLPADKVLPEDWIKRLKGTIEGELQITGGIDEEGGPRLSGDVFLRQGLLEAMPVLERIDEMLGSSRFRRLSFNDFEVRFKSHDGDLQLVDYYARSAGTACLKGHATLDESEPPEGKYMLGITPETINWLPLIKKAVIEGVFSHDLDSAFGQVFGSGSTVKRPPEGFRWAVVRIVPDATDPYTADLREQFFSVGGVAIWGQLVGVSKLGVEALELLADAARTSGADVVDLLSDGADENGGMFAPDNLLAVAGQLGVADSMDKLLRDAAGAVGELPGTILDTGMGLLNGLLP